MFTEECKNELTEHIIPFWNKLRDNEFGGFYGFMNNDLEVDKKADKGVILNSRILWFYSSAYLTVGGEDNLDNAKHAYEFLKNYCVDRENGGVYWMMKYNGEVSDSMKHTYNQAFAIYALSEYYLASKDKDALKLAFELFDTVESKCTDDIAYMEAFDRNWQLIENDALSENGLMADKTMNTVLHLIEGYTVLLKASGDTRVADRLDFLLRLAKDKIFDSENNCLKVFFDTKLNVIGDIHSYGHDIEATWLIDRACEVLGDSELAAEWKEINLRISENIRSLALKNGALNNERENEKIDTKRVWWVQAEGIVGFLNAYKNSGGRKEFLDCSKTLWTWVKEKQIDKRCGEWWGEVAEDGTPMQTVDMVNPWKCPYHNGRMCMEVITRNITEF